MSKTPLFVPEWNIIHPGKCSWYTGQQWSKKVDYGLMIGWKNGRIIDHENLGDSTHDGLWLWNTPSACESFSTVCAICYWQNSHEILMIESIIWKFFFVWIVLTCHNEFHIVWIEEYKLCFLSIVFRLPFVWTNKIGQINVINERTSTIFF